jgi:SAM-dependent methyltransferase
LKGSEVAPTIAARRAVRQISKTPEAGVKSEPLFGGPVPQFYDKYLQPIMGAPFVPEIVARAAAAEPAAILETACGTGSATLPLAKALPLAQIMATDVSADMIDYAKTKAEGAAIVWSQADADDLPFAAHSFDLVFAQFGVMFFSDRPKAFREARRVLRPNSGFLFSVWDDLAVNDLPRVSFEAVVAMFPSDPPTYTRRLPFGYSDRARIERDLRAGGFATIAIEPVRKSLRVATARHYAIGACQGGGLRGEIEARDPEAVARATDIVEQALKQRFGDGPFEVSAQALFVTAS